jgi:hypothetical protein
VRVAQVTDALVERQQQSKTRVDAKRNSPYYLITAKTTNYSVDLVKRWRYFQMTMMKAKIIMMALVLLNLFDITGRLPVKQ